VVRLDEVSDCAPEHAPAQRLERGRGGLLDRSLAVGLGFDDARGLATSVLRRRSPAVARAWLGQRGAHPTRAADLPIGAVLSEHLFGEAASA
jgi:hypothetical protein